MGSDIRNNGLSLKEMLLIVRKQWKVVLLFAIIGALFGGVFGVLSKVRAERATNVVISEEELQQYEKNLNYYNLSQNASNEIMTELKREWLAVFDDRINNPTMSLNAFQIEYEQIALVFDGNIMDYAGVIRNWIADADDKQLFGENVDPLSKYKSSLIIVAEQNDCVVVQVVDCGQYDVAQAAEYLVNHFEGKAASESIDLISVDKAHFSGFCQGAFDVQKYSRENLHSILTELITAQQVKDVFHKPAEVGVGQTVSNKSIIMLVFITFFIGLFVGVLFVLFSVIHNGIICFKRQVESTLGIDIVGNFNNDNEHDFSILKANLDLMTEGNEKIVILANKTLLDGIKDKEEWINSCQREIIFEQNDKDDPDTIIALRDADCAIFGIRLGKSTIDEIRDMALRLNVLQKRIIGYVLL